MIVLYEQSICELTDPKYKDLADKLETYEAYLYDVNMDVKKRIRPFHVLEKIYDQSNFLLKFSTSGVAEESYVGFGAISNYMINILPKIFVEKDINEDAVYRIVLGFLRMLDKAYGLGLPRSIYYAPSELKPAFSNGLHEVLIYLFANILYNELLRGVYREYVDYVGEERFLKGKLLLTRQILKLPMKQHLFSIKYHRLSVNNTLNNILYYAAFLGTKHTRLRMTRHLLQYILALLDDAKTTKPPVNTSIVFNRLNERFKTVYNLARIIIFGLEPEPISEATGLFFDMNDIFEKYVYVILLEKLGDKYRILYQKREPRFITIKDANNNPIRGISQIPDITIISRDNNLPILYVDAKYKSVEKMGKLAPDINDIRQMYIYLKILREKHNPEAYGVVMVYPYVSGLYNKIFVHYEKPLFIGEYDLGEDNEKIYIVGLDMKHLLQERYVIPSDFIKTIENILDGQI